jgi:hypothetical protein
VSAACLIEVQKLLLSKLFKNKKKIHLLETEFTAINVDRKKILQLNCSKATIHRDGNREKRKKKKRKNSV